MMMSWHLLSALFASVALLWVAYNPIAWWRLRRAGVPSPPRLPFLGHLLTIQANTLHGWTFEAFLKYGPIYTAWYGRRPMVLVSDGAAIRKVQQRCSHREVHPGPWRTGADEDFYIEGILFAKDQPHHRAMRSAWAPHFSPLSLANYHAPMSVAAQRLLTYLEPLALAGQPLDINHYVGAMTMEVVGSSAFGIHLDAYALEPKKGDVRPATSASGEQKLGRDVVAATSVVLKSSRPENASLWVVAAVALPVAISQVVAVAAKLLPDAAWRRLMQAQDTLRSVCLTLIRDSRSSSGSSASNTADKPLGQASSGGKGLLAGSFISHLLSERNKTTGEPMTEAALVGNAWTFMAAGYDTSANTLAFTLHHIMTHPEVEAKVLQEVDAFGAAGTVPSLEQLAQFPYLAACIDESLRLKPTATLLFRRSSEVINLLGHDVPAGTTFLLSLYNVHHNPAVWRDAESFVPERFLPGHPEWAAPEGQYMPFGGGSRACIGQRFALQEMKLALVALFQRFIFRLAPGFAPLQLVVGITMGPKEPMMVTAHAR